MSLEYFQSTGGILAGSQGGPRMTRAGDSTREDAIVIIDPDRKGPRSSRTGAPTPFTLGSNTLDRNGLEPMRPASTSNGAKYATSRNAPNAQAGSSRPKAPPKDVAAARRPLGAVATRGSPPRRARPSISPSDTVNRDRSSVSPSKPGPGVYRNPYFESQRALGNDDAEPPPKYKGKKPERDRRQNDDRRRLSGGQASTANNRSVSPSKKTTPGARPSHRQSTPEEADEPIESPAGFDNHSDIEVIPMPGTIYSTRSTKRQDEPRRGQPISSASPPKVATASGKRIKEPDGERKREVEEDWQRASPRNVKRLEREHQARTGAVKMIGSSHLARQTPVVGATCLFKTGTVRMLLIEGLHVVDRALVFETERSTHKITVPVCDVTEARVCPSPHCPSVTVFLGVNNGLDREYLKGLISKDIVGVKANAQDLQDFEIHLRLPPDSSAVAVLNAMKAALGDKARDVSQDASCEAAGKAFNSVRQHMERKSQNTHPSRSHPSHRQESSVKKLPAKVTLNDPKGKGKAKADPDQSTLSFPSRRQTEGHARSNSPGLRRSARQSNASIIDDGDDIQEAKAGPSRSPAVPPPPDRDEVLFPFPLTGRSLLNITKGDRWRVENGEYLNDTLLEWGLRHMLALRDKDGPDSDVHLFNSFFYQKIGSRDKRRLKPGGHWPAYDTVRKWTKGTDIFSKRFIIVPINEDLHWYLAVIYNPAAIMRSSVAVNDAASPRNPSIGPSVDVPPLRPETARTSDLESDEEMEVDKALAPSTPKTDNGPDHDSAVNDGESIEEDPLDCIERSRPAASFSASLSAKIEDDMENLGINSEQPHPDNPKTVPPPAQISVGRAIDPHTLLGLREDDSTSTPPAPKCRTADFEPDHQILTNEKCWIFTFDSLGTSHLAVSNTLNRWLVAEAKDKMGIGLDPETARAGYIHAQVPLQDNDSDCGLFLVHYATQLVAKPEEVLRFIERRPVKPTGQGRDAYLKTVDDIWGTKNHVLRDEWQATINSLETQYRQIKKEEARNKSASAALSRSPEKAPEAPAPQAELSPNKVDEDIMNDGGSARLADAEHVVVAAPDLAIPDSTTDSHASATLEAQSAHVKASDATNNSNRDSWPNPSEAAAPETTERVEAPASPRDTILSALQVTINEGGKHVVESRDDEASDHESRPDDRKRHAAHRSRSTSPRIPRQSDRDNRAVGPDGVLDDSESEASEEDEAPESSDVRELEARSPHDNAIAIDPESGGANDKNDAPHQTTSESASSTRPTPASLLTGQSTGNLPTTVTPQRLTRPTGRIANLVDSEPQSLPTSSPLTALSDHTQFSEDPIACDNTVRPRPDIFTLRPLRKSQTASSPSRVQAQPDPSPSRGEVTSVHRVTSSTAREAPPALPGTRPPWFSASKETSGRPLAGSMLPVGPASSSTEPIDVDIEDDQDESSASSTPHDSGKENHTVEDTEEKENRFPPSTPTLSNSARSPVRPSESRTPFSPTRSIHDVSDDEPEQVSSYQPLEPPSRSRTRASLASTNRTPAGIEQYLSPRMTTTAPRSRPGSKRGMDDPSRRTSSSARSPLGHTGAPETRLPLSTGGLSKRQGTIGPSHPPKDASLDVALSNRRNVKTYAKRKSHEPGNTYLPSHGKKRRQGEPRDSSMGHNMASAIDIDDSDSDG